MSKVLILKGLPASGKSTYARELMAKEPGKWKRINKDDLRNMLDDGKWSKENEKRIIEVRNMLIRKFFYEGNNVVVDDTNLARKNENEIFELFKIDHELAGASIPFTYPLFEIKTFDTPVEECVRRDALRPGRDHVGEKVIRDMARVFNWPPKPIVEPYADVPGRPTVVICDIDGTLAEKGDRNAYDWGKVFNDKPILKIIRVLRMLVEQNNVGVVLVSGRDSICVTETRKWLYNHSIPYNYLFMRPKGDNRPDTVIKREIFDNHIRDKYNVLCVLDDRNKVVKMWRELGLTCL